jgi:peptidoglycan/xylan/chitin deacetylase (PgdA/CDA1 family)
MRIVSPFLKNVLYPSLSSVGIFRHTSATGLAIVTYHGVTPEGYEAVDPAFDGNLVSAETLRRQLRLLKAHYNIITPEDLLAWRDGEYTLPQKAVLLTCDDGLLNNYTDMLPILREENVKCLFFVTGSSAEDARTMLWYEELFLLFLRAPDGPFEISHDKVAIGGELGTREQRRAAWWSAVKRLSECSATIRASFLEVVRQHFGSDSRRPLDHGDTVSCRRFGLMTATELRQMVSAGMTIGAHTMSHPMLSKLPQAAARAEVVECKTRLEAVLEMPVWAFAYPFGDAQSVTPQILGMPENAGYTAAFLNYGGGLGSNLPPYALPRLHVTSEMSLAEFEAHVSGFYGQLQRVVRRSA